jgi:hypothetical protein
MQFWIVFCLMKSKWKEKSEHSTHLANSASSANWTEANSGSALGTLGEKDAVVSRLSGNENVSIPILGYLLSLLPPNVSPSSVIGGRGGAPSPIKALLESDLPIKDLLEPALRRSFTEFAKVRVPLRHPPLPTLLTMELLLLTNFLSGVHGHDWLDWEPCSNDIATSFKELVMFGGREE